jgi:hypothetical protein
MGNPITTRFDRLDVLRFPCVGSSKSYVNDVYGRTGTLLNLGAGERGVVRTIWFCVLDESAGWNTFGPLDVNSRLRIYVDCGTVADPNNPPSDKLAVDLPLCALAGRFFVNRWTLPAVLETAIHEVGWSPTIAGWFNQEYSFQLRLPVPYSNGILIQHGKLVDGNWIVAPAYQWSWVGYESGPLPSDERGRYRLRSSFYHGTLTGEQTATFLNRASKAGFLVALFASQNAANGAAWEGNFAFKLDGDPNVTWQSSGACDLFGTQNSWWGPGVAQGQYSGTIVKAFDTNYAGVHESYRIFTTDPVNWKNGVVGQWPNLAGITESYITCLFYERT